MALNGNRGHEVVTITGRTWFCTGTIMIAMGIVAMAAGLMLQNQLSDSKCKESSNCIFQSLNVKAGISCGIMIVFCGLFTISVGIRLSKAMVLMLAILSVLLALSALILLVISEVIIVSSFHQNMSTVYLPFTTPKGPCSESFRGRQAEMKKGPQVTTPRQGDSFLRFSPSDEAIQLEQSILRGGDNDTGLDQISAPKNNEAGHNSKYQHEPSTYSGNRRVGSWSENAEERGRDMDRHLNLRKLGGEDSLEFEQMLRSSAEASSSDDGVRTKGTTTLASKTRETESTSYDWSGFGEGFNDDEDSYWAVEKRREEVEYDSYSELEEGEGNKAAEGQHIFVFANWYEDDFRGKRNKRDWKQDCPDEEEIARQWLIQLIMSCLMAVVGFIVFVWSIVTATLAFALFCCYQTDQKTNAQRSSNRKQSASTAAAAGKDDGDVPLLSDDENLLQV